MLTPCRLIKTTDVSEGRTVFIFMAYQPKKSSMGTDAVLEHCKRVGQFFHSCFSKEANKNTAVRQ